MNRGEVASVHRLAPLVVVSDFRIEDAALFPAEAYTPLVVDPDTPLTGSVAGKLFEPVSGRGAKKIEGRGSVQLFEFAL